MTNQPTREETPMSPIEITANQRGFHQYGEPVRTAYGDTVEVYESSSAEAPHCWLRIDGLASGITDQKGRDMTAHLNLEQAVAIRDRLNAWINEVPTRWGLKTGQTTMSDNPFSDCSNGAAVISTIAYMAATNGNGSICAETIADALARIAELTPRTVTPEARERAREIVSGWVDGMQCHAVVDRIIDALGWTFAPQPEPQMTTDKYGRNACVCGYVPPTHTHADDCPVFGTQARAQAPAPAPATPAAEPERDCENCDGRKCMSCCSREMHDDCADDCPMCCPAPVPPAPVVELDADELRALADIVEAHEHSPEGIGPMTLRGGLLAIVDNNGASVLRIGGDE